MISGHHFCCNSFENDLNQSDDCFEKFFVLISDVEIQSEGWKDALSNFWKNLSSSKVGPMLEYYLNYFPPQNIKIDFLLVAFEYISLHYHEISQPFFIDCERRARGSSYRICDSSFKNRIDPILVGTIKPEKYFKIEEFTETGSRNVDNFNQKSDIKRIVPELIADLSKLNIEIESGNEDNLVDLISFDDFHNHNTYGNEVIQNAIEGLAPRIVFNWEPTWIQELFQSLFPWISLMPSTNSIAALMITLCNLVISMFRETKGDVSVLIKALEMTELIMSTQNESISLKLKNQSLMRLAYSISHILYGISRHSIHKPFLSRIGALLKKLMALLNPSAFVNAILIKGLAINDVDVLHLQIRLIHDSIFGAYDYPTIPYSAFPQVANYENLENLSFDNNKSGSNEFSSTNTGCKKISIPRDLAVSIVESFDLLVNAIVSLGKKQSLRHASISLTIHLLSGILHSQLSEPTETLTWDLLHLESLRLKSHLRYSDIYFGHLDNVMPQVILQKLDNLHTEIKKSRIQEKYSVELKPEFDESNRQIYNLHSVNKKAIELANQNSKARFSNKTCESWIREEIQSMAYTIISFVLETDSPISSEIELIERDSKTLSMLPGKLLWTIADALLVLELCDASRIYNRLAQCLNITPFIKAKAHICGTLYWIVHSGQLQLHAGAKCVLEVIRNEAHRLAADLETGLFSTEKNAGLTFDLFIKYKKQLIHNLNLLQNALRQP